MEFEDKVYKKSSLEHNDSISTYNGWGAQQNPNAFEAFHNLIKEVKPIQILEIGTALGGFTSFLKYTCDLFNYDYKLISYDIYERQYYQDMVNEGIDVRVENIFDEEYTIVKQEVIDFIRNSGTTLILCDGGNKIKEFNLLSNYMKEGDIIMAHDYAENKEVFDNKIYMNIWNWFEISDNDINESCLRNNLIQFKKEIFDNVVWVSKRKI